MADLNAKIIPLHSEVEGRVPLPEQVDVGEIALSLADKKIYSKNSAGEIVVLGEVDQTDVDGLPGGGFKPNQILPPSYRYTYSTGVPGAGEILWESGRLYFDGLTADGEDVSAELKTWEAPGSIFISIDEGLTYTEIEYEEVGDGSPSDLTYFSGGEIDTKVPPLLTGADLYLRRTDAGEPLDIPLAGGDVLRYDGEFWRPIKFRIENLDNVQANAVGTSQLFWTSGPLVAGKVPEGKVRIDGARLKFHYVDGLGVDRGDDWRAWLTDLRGQAVDDGDQFDLTTTLHIWVDGVRYETTTSEVDDDQNTTGEDEDTWHLECDLIANNPDLIGDNRIYEIEEFNSFLGVSMSTVVNEERAVLQWVEATSKWTSQLLDFNLDEAANVALRVDSGSGTEIPKATGDALLWDGTNWTPSSPLSGSGISALSDVNTITTSPSDGQALVWDNANGYWKPGTVASDTPDVALDDLTDATVTTPANGEVLEYQNGVWVNAALTYAGLPDAPTVPQNLGDLNDVDLSLAPVPGQALVWDGTAWKPADQTGGGGSGDSVVGALTERADVSITESFTTGQSKNVQFSGLGEAGKFVQVTVSFPAWVRFYATAEDRDADALRPVDEDPIAGSGVLMELRTTTADEVVKITPGAIYYNNDILPSQTLYARITNEAGSATSITTTVRSYTSTSTDAIDGGTFGSG